MIPHPNAINDPKHFLGDLEVLLRRYGVSIEMAAIVRPDGLPVLVGGFRASRWLIAFDTPTIDHATIKRLVEQQDNVEAGTRDRQVKL